MRAAPLPLLARAGAVALVATALCFALANTAWGWRVTNPASDILRIEREATDSTGTVVWTVYGTATNGTGSQWANGSYDSTAAGGIFNGASSFTVQMDPGATVAEYAVLSWMSNAVRILAAGPNGLSEVVVLATADKRLPLPVSVQGTVPVSAGGTLPVSVVGTVPVSQTASVSLAGTLPVDPWSTADLPDRWQVGFAVLAVLLLGIHGAVMLSRLNRRKKAS